MIRRIFIAGLLVAGCLMADSASDVLDVVASMAAGLSEDNAPAFEKPLAADLPGRDRLLADVRAAIAQAELTSGIYPISNEGDDRQRTLVLDWALELKRRGSDLRIERRRKTITLTLVLEGKLWKVTSLTPADFFAPPDFR